MDITDIEHLNNITIKTYHINKLTIHSHHFLIICLIKGTATTGTNSVLCEQQMIFLGKNTELTLLSKTRSEFVILSIEFEHPNFSLNQVNIESKIDDNELYIIKQLMSENKKSETLKRQKPSMKYDYEIGQYYRACLLNKQILLFQLLLMKKAQKIFETLPSNYIEHLQNIDEPLPFIKEGYILEPSYIIYGNPLIDDIIEYMHTHLHDNLSINEISQLFFTSPANLKKQFKKYTNKSIISYFKELKMQKACQWIIENKYSYTEISERLGFKTIHHFSSAFKKYSGYSPSKYFESKQHDFVEKVKDTDILINEHFIVH